MCLHSRHVPVLRGPPLGIVGGGDAIEAVRRQISKVADLDVPVLVRGESGTGKELVARALDDIGALPDESASDPDEEIERQRLAARIATALSSLPDVERRVVELHYYDDLSFAEIGEKLGICKPWAFRLHKKALR